MNHRTYNPRLVKFQKCFTSVGIVRWNVVWLPEAWALVGEIDPSRGMSKLDLQKNPNAAHIRAWRYESKYIRAPISCCQVYQMKPDLEYLGELR